MDIPLISVIIPVYNSEEHLTQCLESVCNQTFQNLEIICVDDGSSDSSYDIIKNLSLRDMRIRIIRQENAGAGAARNRGLREARGEYLSFLDSDDFFEPEMYETAFELIEKYKADFIVYNSDQYHSKTDSFQSVPWVLHLKDIPPYMPFNQRQLTDNIFKVFVGWAWDKLYRAEFVRKHGLFFQEQRTSNDLYFVYIALALADKIAVTDKVLAHQRRDQSGSLSVTREKSWDCFYKALVAIRERLEKEGRFWEFEQDYINYALHFSLWNLRTLSEPTKSILSEKLRKEWFDDLGIAGKDKDYFYNKFEYNEYLSMMNKH